MTWQRHREATNRDPLVHLSLARVPPVRSGLIGMFSQNLILMGIFFVVPLYLQLVLGLSALETGIKMLPISITMFATSAIGSRLSNRFPVRAIVQSGLIVTLAGALVLLATIQPTLSSAGFGLGMAVLGVGMGLMISQLGNVVQSSVEESGRSEAGGLQYTGQQLGSSLGVALIGAIVLIGLTSTFTSNVRDDPRISADVSAQVGVAAGSNTNFVSTTQIDAAAKKAGLDTATTAALVDDYEAAQLRSLKAGLLAAALLALISLGFTRELPHDRPAPGPNVIPQRCPPEPGVVAEPQESRQPCPCPAPLARQSANVSSRPGGTGGVSGGESPAVVGQLGGHLNRETQRPEDLPACRDHPGRAYHRGNGDHDSLDVVGGDPAVLGGPGIGEVGGRRRVHRDQGRDPGEHELARGKRIVLDRRRSDVGEGVKDRCIGGHVALLQFRWHPLPGSSAPPQP